jgi:hypothetical protein
VLTASEFLRGNDVTTAEVVRHFRPRFLLGTLTPTGSGFSNVMPSVYQNGVYAGGLDALGTIPIGAVAEIRFIRPADAHDFWGPSCPCTGGVIHVRTKPVR